MAKISKMDRQREGTQLNQSDLSEPPKGEQLRNTDKNGETWFGAAKKEGGGGRLCSRVECGNFF